MNEHSIEHGLQRPWHRFYPEGSPVRLEVAPRPVQALFEDAARDFPSSCYISYRGADISYAQAMSRIKHIAAALQHAGIERGDRVGICLPTMATFPLIAIAVWTAGGVTVAMNPVYGADMLRRQVEDSGLRLLVTIDSEEMRAKFAPISSVGAVRFVYAAPDASDILDEKVGEGPQDRESLTSFLEGVGASVPVELDPIADLAAIQFTGGTTGVPKGAMHTHAALYLSNQQMRWAVPQLTRGDVVTAIAAPLSHIGALQAGMNLVTTLAGRMILLDRFDPSTFIRLIEEERINYFPGVPTMLTAMLNTPEIHDANLTSLRAVTNGAAPPPVEIQRAFQQLSGVVIQPTYGLTETSMCVAGPICGRPDFAAAGIPLVGVDIEIRCVKDPAKRMPIGEVGEICVGGPQVMQGYWDRPVETAEAMIDGMVRTGDLGKMDENGFVYVVDRLKDVILCSGYNVFPTVVEDAIYRHPAVAECIVVGTPDAYRGETVTAFVTLRNGHCLTLPALQEFLRTALSPMEIPKVLEIRPSLPKTAAAKLSRQMLRDELLAAQA